MTQRLFRPSQAGFWGKCSAFTRFTEHLPEQEESDPAREGTCAAWVADQAILNGVACAIFVGQQHKNGWTVTAEMASDVQGYVDKVLSLGVGVTAEEHVTASENPLIAGTLDSSISAVVDGILDIIDLKYGRLIVEPTALQLVCYAWGKYLTFPQGVIKKIRLSIYQPRAFHSKGIFRTRTVTPEELHAEFTALWNKAVENEKPDSIATPGSHCVNCDASTTCEAFIHTVYKTINIVESREQRDLTTDELSRELDFMEECKKIVSARFKSLETEAGARLKRESIPGWKMTHREGNRAFTVSPTTVHLMSGIDPSEEGTCTPAELERRGASKEVMKLIAAKPRIGSKLARFTQKDIAEAFEKGNEE